MLRSSPKSAHAQFSHKHPRQHAQKVSNIEGHDRQHPMVKHQYSSLLHIQRRDGNGALQEITNSRNHHDDERSRDIHGDPPLISRPLLTQSRPWGKGCSALVLRRCVLRSASNDNRLPLLTLLVPSSFEHVSVGQQTAEDGGKDEEKDTSSSVGARRLWSEGSGVEGSVVGECEDGMHHRRLVRRVGRRGGG